MSFRPQLVFILIFTIIARLGTTLTIPEFDHKLATYTFESSHHRDATLAIARSQLGQEFIRYMFEPADLSTQYHMLEQLIGRTFQKGGKSITAQSALYLMVTEIYKMGALDTESLMRLQLFQTAMNERQTTGIVYLGKHITTIAAVIALIATAVGLYQGSPQAILQNFFKFMGPTSFLYFFWFDQVQKARGNSVFDEIHSKNEKSWQRFVSELEKL